MKRFALLLIAALMSGCSTVSDYTTEFFGGKDNADPPAELVEFAPTLKVQKLWSTTVGVGVKESYLKLSPVIKYGKLYAADVKGLVTAYDAESGRVLWRTETNLPISGGPGTGDGKVYVGTRDAEVIALDGDTGKVLWRQRVTSEVLAAPRSEQGFVVVRSVDGKLAGLDAATGKRLWIQDRKTPVLTLRGSSSPVLFLGGAIIGLADGKIAAITLDGGKTVWESRVALPSGRSDLERMVDIDSDPLVADGVIHAVTFQGNIATLELRTGQVLWRRKMSSHAGLGMDSRYLYVTDDESHIWALDRRNSNSLWKQDKLHARAATAPAYQNGYVVVGDLQGYLHWMSSDDGSFVARIRVDETPIIAAPIVDGDILYVETSGGTLSAYRVFKL